MRSLPFRRLAQAVCASGLVVSAHAVPPPVSIPATTDESATQSPGFWGFLDGVDRSNALLGDMWGLRSKLSQQGITLSVQETSEVLGNLTGGTQTGFDYDGLTQVVMQMDTQRAFGHPGGMFNASLLNVHGSNLSANNLDTLQTASGIEADRSTRLWELWYEQKFFDDQHLGIKVGQQSLDQEFMVSNNALVFVNTMFGWPMLPSADMPAGGPAYPLSALGARVSYRPTDGVTLLAGVFNGSPLKHDNGTDPQLQDAHGTNFAWGSGRLLIAEAQFSYPSPGAMVEPGQAEPLGWTYRIGGWYDTQSFADQRLDTSGLSLANPASNGNPMMHSGNYALYAVADKLVWRDEQDPNRTASIFGRIMGTPLRDRNLIDFSLNAGVVFHSPFRYRTDDTFGLGMGYAHVSSSASQLDRDNIAFGNNVPGPVRSSETYLEATYQYQLRPWIQLQPDIQYVINPGAGIPLPSNPSQRIANEWVVGLRVNVSF